MQVQIKERQIGIPLRFPPQRRSPATFKSNKKDLKANSQRQPAKINVVVREKPQSNLKSVCNLFKDLGDSFVLGRFFSTAS